MAKINKNTHYPKHLKKFILEKGEHTLTFLPTLPIPKEGTKIGSFHNYCDWIPVTKATQFSVECKPNLKCPICEMLKPKTRWQKIKEKIKSLFSKK